MSLHAKMFIGYVAVTTIALWWLCRCHDRREKKTMAEFWKEKDRRRKTCTQTTWPHVCAFNHKPTAASAADEEER